MSLGIIFLLSTVSGFSGAVLLYPIGVNHSILEYGLKSGFIAYW